MPLYLLLAPLWPLMPAALKILYEAISKTAQFQSSVSTKIHRRQVSYIWSVVDVRGINTLFYIYYFNI